MRIDDGEPRFYNNEDEQSGGDEPPEELGVYQLITEKGFRCLVCPLSLNCRVKAARQTEQPNTRDAHQTAGYGLQFAGSN